MSSFSGFVFDGSHHIFFKTFRYTLVFLVLIYLLRRVPWNWPRQLAVLSWIGLVWLLSTAVFYIFFPGYFDHTIPSVASVAANWFYGHHDLYHGADSGARYAMIYGPWTFLLSAWSFILPLPAIEASKVSGVLCLFIMLILFGVQLRKLPLERHFKMIALGALVFACMSFEHFSYWSRPESFLLLAIVYVLMAFANLSRPASALEWTAVGLLGGLSVNSKIHAGLYFAPILLFQLEHYGWKQSLSLRKCGGMLMGAAVGLVGPFLLPGISFPLFWYWALIVSKVPRSLNLLMECLTYAVPWLVLLERVGFYSRWPRTFICLVVCVVITACFGSKVGAGPHHMMLYVPIFILFTTFAWTQDRSRSKPYAVALATAVFLSFVLCGYEVQRFLSHQFLQWSHQAEVRKDLERLVKNYPGSRDVGYSDAENYWRSFFRPLVVAQSADYSFDFPAVTEMSGAGVRFPENTWKRLESCAVKTMILPKGRPWQMTGYFGDELFSSRFQHAFLEHYRLVGSSENFQIFQCE